MSLPTVKALIEVDKEWYPLVSWTNAKGYNVDQIIFFEEDEQLYNSLLPCIMHSNEGKLWWFHDSWRIDPSHEPSIAPYPQGRTEWGKIMMQQYFKEQYEQHHEV